MPPTERKGLIVLTADLIGVTFSCVQDTSSICWRNCTKFALGQGKESNRQQYQAKSPRT